MKPVSSLGLWLRSGWPMLVLLAAIAVYVVAEKPDNFWPGAMGNLLATTVGIAAGVPVGLELGRRQQEAQRRREMEEKAAEDREKLNVALMRIFHEMLRDGRTLKAIEEILTKAPEPRLDVWEWAERLANGLSTRAYDDLIATPLEEQLPARLRSRCGLSYSLIREAQTMVQSGPVAFRVLAGYYNDNERAAQERDAAVAAIRDASGSVRNTTKAIVDAGYLVDQKQERDA